MLRNNTQWIAILAIALSGAGLAVAQTASSPDDQALINALIKKGILTNAEAKQISAEVAKSQSGEDVETSGDSFIRKVTVGGRWQAQYVGLGASIRGNPVNPVSTEHFLLRRIYLNFSAQFDDGLSGVVSYDVANTSFNQAFIQWKQSPLFSVRAGLDKAPFGYEELISSGDLKAIERSVITNYIDNPNNGRRLGASSYHTGIFFTGAYDGFFYNAALTNPERNEYSGDSNNTAILVNGLGGVGSTGTGTTNKFAAYANAGYGGQFEVGGAKASYKLGYETGFLPDQGGPAATIGTGRDITLDGVFLDTTVGAFSLLGEWESAKDDAGVKNGVSATPKGYWIQPSLKFTPQWEGVVNYSVIDSNGRGVALSDVIRSAPSGGTMNKADEWYVGLNYYIKGNDVKLQTGYIYGESKETVTGAGAKATTEGVRSQVQVQF
jgi:phosphate-selective porin